MPRTKAKDFPEGSRFFDVEWRPVVILPDGKVVSLLKDGGTFPWSAFKTANFGEQITAEQFDKVADEWFAFPGDKNA